MTSDDTYVLDDAKRRVYDRADTHGEPEDSFAQIARQWTTWMDDDVTAFDVCVMMTQFKLARVKEGESTYESLLDAAGYIECAARLHVENGDVEDDLVADAEALAEEMAPSADDGDEDDSFLDELSVLKSRPDEWLSVAEIMQALDTDDDYWGYYNDPRAEVTDRLQDVADGWNEYERRTNGGDVQYRYVSDPSTDDTDEDDAVEPLLTDDDDDTASDVYDSGLAVLRDRPNEWVSADMIEQLVDADQTHNVRLALADAAVNMDCVQSLDDGETVEYGYIPDRDPCTSSVSQSQTTDSDGTTDDLSVTTAALNTLEQRPEQWLSVHDIYGHLLNMDWDGDVDLLGDIAAVLQRADETRTDIESRSGTVVVQYRYVPDNDRVTTPTSGARDNSDGGDDDAGEHPDEYGAACRNASSSDDEPFDVTD